MSDALLVLEDGTAFRGQAFGAEGETFGEAVFNTAMAGYQEVLTDPSYRRQVVAMTAPHVGNYGWNDEDGESGAIQVAGLVVREASRRASSWRSRGSLQDALTGAGVVGIEGVDTRRLTLQIRRAGAMRAGISTEELDPGPLAERVRAHPGMEGADLAAAVSTQRAYRARDLVGPPESEGRIFRVAAYDFGIKRNILRRLARSGCETTVVPAQTPSEEVLGGRYDGVFLSNGPGDPAATTYGVDAARGLLGAIPLFGICLGHQLMALALGGRTYKLPFGHRGVNQPVKDVETGRVEITSHNHGFAVDSGGWGDRAPIPSGAGSQGAAPGDAGRVRTAFGDAVLNRWNLNDGTLEGLRCLEVPALSVQYHPEAAPGPHDSSHLFAEFRALMS